jgi:O-antigen/teichoic acid export membrane protein
MSSSLKTVVSRHWRSTLGRNTVWMFLGQGLRLLIQAAYFVIIARSLGVEQYGAFAAVTAMVSILSPFVGLGCTNLIVKNVARNGKLLDESFGNGVATTVATGLLGVLIVLGIYRWTMPGSIKVTVVVMVALADLVGMRLTLLVASAFQAVERLGKTAQFNVLISGARFAGIALTVSAVHHPTAQLWSVIYAGSTLVAMAISLFSVTVLVKTWRVNVQRIKREALEGLFFSGSQSAQTVYNDVDKTMLARLSTLDANGIYAAAYRIIDVSFIPISSVLYAAYPRYFRHEPGDVRGTYNCAKRLLPVPLGFALSAFVVLLLGAPLIPTILGADYSRTVEAVRWLSILPLSKTIHYFFADALSGAGYQAPRTLLQVIVAIFNVFLNLWVIPAYSWRGAAWSSLASDGVLALLVWSMITVLRLRQPALCPAATSFSLHGARKEEGEYV